jgi:hypothetical protein
MSGADLMAAAAVRLQQVRIPKGRARLTNTQALAEAQVLATLAVAEELRTQNALAALALGTSGLDLAQPDKAKGETTQIRQRRMNTLRRIVRAEFDLDGRE